MAHKILTGVLATITKICTKGGLKRSHERSSTPPSRQLTRCRLSGVVSATRAHRSYEASAASIFIAGEFGRCVVTRSLADGDFHAHRPSVYIRQQIFWGLERFELATLARVSVHPASPARLTQDGPLRFQIPPARTPRLRAARVPSNFENWRKRFPLPDHYSFDLPHSTRLR